MKLKRWSLTALQSMAFKIEVEAKDMQEARSKAKGIDCASWKKQALWNDDWEIVDVEEIQTV